MLFALFFPLALSRLAAFKFFFARRYALCIMRFLLTLTLTLTLL